MGKMADIEEDIRIAQKLVDATSESDPHRAEYLNLLGVGLVDRYHGTGAMADLEEAIRVGREAVGVMRDDSDPSQYLRNLGVRLNDRYLATGAITDLEEAIQFERKAVDATLEDDSDRAKNLNTLGTSLYDRYSRTGSITDLEEAIQLIRESVDETLKDDPHWAVRINNLGYGFMNRYLRTGAIVDLDEAIQCIREAVDTGSEDDPERVQRLSNLNVALADRYLRTGLMTDLDEAIQVGRKTVDATPENNSSRARYLNNHGTGLTDRYQRTGAMADLEEAIQIGREAVHATPKDHPSRPRYLNNLGDYFSDRFSRTGAIMDLEEAIQLGKEAINITPENHPDRIQYLSNFGANLSARYLKLRAITDLDEAIQTEREAVDMTPKDHPDRARYLYNLGAVLSIKYLETGAMIDLEEAIQVGQEAIHATPENHPNQAHYLCHLGNRLSDRYLETGATVDLENAISYHQSALSQLTSFTITRIAAGRAVLQECALISDWQQAYEASEIAVHLIPRLTPRSLDNSDKQHMLSQVVGLASNAAAAALQVGKSPLVALNFLEQGRGVLAASLEEIRTDVLDLQKEHPRLAEQFIRSRDELELPAIRNMSSIKKNHELTWYTQTNRRYEAGNEFDRVVIEIRKQPGFEDFLLAPSKAEMQDATKYGPIVIINVSDYRCDAILIKWHEIQLLTLSNLNAQEIDKQAQRKDLENTEVLEWLWKNICNPILEALEFTQSPSDGNWPHVWWIPTGPLSKFPLHAAGYHTKDSSETVLDRVMSSYSSSVKAIIYGRRQRISGLTQSAQPQALLIAMQDTPEYPRLLSAKKEIEIVRNLCKSMALDPIEPKRHKQDILPHLLNCKILHFAGHGHTEKLDPSKSQLLLEDWKNDSLTVATLLEANLREHSPFLAYLSACGTGQIHDYRFMDESIHLISACQLAGYRHVIGTLWNVDDDICVEIAKITYEGMRNGGMTDESVCRGLHNATRELRDRWLTARAIRGSRLVKEADVLLEDKTKAGNATDGDQGDERKPRDAILCDDDDDDEGRESLHWVPYVHFGV